MKLTRFFFQQSKKRQNANVIYNSSLPVIFGVKHYADQLWKIVDKRDIKVNLRTNLIEVIPDKNQAVFENLDKPEEKFTTDVSFLFLHLKSGLIIYFNFYFDSMNSSMLLLQ